MKKLSLILLVIFFSNYSILAFQEYQVKAYFIFNFSKFITWPNLDSKDEFVISIFGKSSLLKPLKEIAGKLILYYDHE